MPTMLHRHALCLTTLALASCAVGPNYKKPDTADITPAKWRWQPAAPSDDTPRGEWWKVFRDSELNRLESLALAASPSLRAALARVDQARASARISAAPNVTSRSLPPAGGRHATSIPRPNSP